MTAFVHYHRMANPGKMTGLWQMRTAPDGGGILLGHVRWHTPWRRFCAFPNLQCLFDAGCLRDIAQFCEDRTNEQKRDAAARRQARQA